MLNVLRYTFRNKLKYTNKEKYLKVAIGAYGKGSKVLLKPQT